MAAGDPGSPARYYSSTAVETSLQSSIAAQSQGASNTSFIVASISGFPTSYPYTLIVDPDTSKEEVLTVYAGSSTTLSVYRGADNTQAVAHSAGAVVRHGVSARDFRESENHIAARGYDIDQAILDAANQTHVHGIATGDGVIVGTDKEQTLNNKTIGANGLKFEGATTNAFDTTLNVEDPTANRAITFPNTSGTVTINDAAQTLSNKTLGSNLLAATYKITGLGDPSSAQDAATKNYVDTGVSSGVVQAAASAAAAATSATSASNSATAAATSASSAAASASASASSASASATSATAAATSATSAANSATAAATSATSAANSATAAATSATSAATSATSAAASATTAAASVATIAGYAAAAATSEANALTSANSAAASATAAATSATSAAASATSAANSASAAATSATSAAASATAAATSETNAAASATAAATSASSASTSASSALTSANSASTSAASAATSASSAAASFDSFDDRYLGPKASAPTVDNDGNPLTGGVLYYNTTSGVMFVYNGNTSAWEQVAVSTSGFPTLAGNNDFTGLNTFTNAGTADVLRVTNTGTGNSFVVEDSANPDATPFVIDQNGAVAIGNANKLTAGGNQLVSIFGAGTNYPLILGQYLASSAGPRLTFAKTRSTTPGTFATVVAGDVLGENYFYGDDGTSFVASARIAAQAEGTISTGVIPSRLIFSTADSAGTVTERMRIDSAGNVGVGTTGTTLSRFNLGGNYTASSGVSQAIRISGTITSATTSTAASVLSVPSTQAASFTLANLYHFQAAQGTIGAGSAITTQIGYLVGSDMTGATNNYGFYADLPAATGRYNFIATGTAVNYFAGRVGIGAIITSGAMAQVTNTTASDIGFIVKGAASQSGDLLQVQNSAATELFTIDSAGKVGIGNASPTYTLDVSSTARVGGSATNSGSALLAYGQMLNFTNINWNFGNLELVRNATNTSTPRFLGMALDGDSLTATTIGAYNSIWGIYDSTPTTGSLSSTLNSVMAYGAYAGHRWYTNGTERMRIDSSGNVNIGAATPAAGGTNTAGLSIAGKDIEMMLVMDAY